MSKTSIYRFKFCENVTIRLTEFARIHQYDNRHEFKDAWGVWCENNKILINAEVQRLTNLGYTGNVEDKMFKSARYYFCKKELAKEGKPEETLKKEEEEVREKEVPKKTIRRNYISMGIYLLNDMDNHIERNINSRNFTPAQGYTDFCQNNVDILTKEIKRICANHDINGDELTMKVKKTYKNRYYQYTHTNKNID
jgi:hypothetical protein